jgi:hypothetical protein
MSDNSKPASDYNPDAITVDVSKLRVGDYVTVRTKVLAFEGPQADALPITIDPNPWANEIVGHEPAAA